MAKIEDINRQIVRLRADTRDRLAHISQLLPDNCPSAQAAIDEAIDLEATAIRTTSARLKLRLVSDQSGDG